MKKLSVSEIIACLTEENLSSETQWDILNTLGLELEDESNVLSYFDELKGTLNENLTAFNALTFPKGFGFDPLTLEQTLTFFTDPKQFSLKMNKEKGKGILYGKDHVKFRQNLTNHLPKPLRLAIIKDKLDVSGVLSHCLAFFDADDIAHGIQVSDILDIGVSHSVYKVTLAAGDNEKTVVVKVEGLPHQPYFCQLLRDLNWPSYHSIHVEDDQGSWEISEFLGEHSLQECLEEKGDKRDILEKELAYHAALGDVLGRGDRHLENYLNYNGNVVPVDISYLFWEDNDDWTSHYIRGGMYEINVLADYSHDPATLEKKTALFFTHYQEALADIAQKKEILKQHIHDFFNRIEPHTEHKTPFFEQRLENLDEFFQIQKARYQIAFEHYLESLSVKEKLEALGNEDLAVLDKNPRLKMYYLANKGRYASFYLISDEDFAQVKEDLERL